MSSEDTESTKASPISKLHEPSTDCTFIFGGEEIGAHKIVLTCCSPVFEKMLYGKLASSRITITDISLEDFGQMLKFIYTNTVRIKSVLHAWSLFYVAHKYLLDGFGDVCVSYIQQNLNINNLVLNYEYAEMYGVEQLQLICMNHIVFYVRGVFLKICDYHMKPTSLGKILEQKTLHISNNELIIGVLNWAVTECDIKNISLSAENVVNLLRSLDILQYLSNLDFTINPNSDSLILSCSYLLKSLKDPGVPYRQYLKKHWCTFCKCRQTYKIADRIELRERDVLISNISVNRTCLLFGLVVLTENEQVGNAKNDYDGVIQIKIGEANNPEDMVQTTFHQSLLYETSVYVPLSHVFYLESNQIYSIQIKYKNFDNFNDPGARKSSVLRYYMSNKMVDEGKNTVVSFDELDGSVIRGISYYPV